MSVRFYEYIDTQLQKALPANARRIPAEKLLGKEPCRIRHAFHTSPIIDRSRLVNVLALPLSFPLTSRHEVELIKLRDYILSKDCLLVVVYEEERTGSAGDLGVFIEDSLATVGPGVLRLRCPRDNGYRVTLDYDRFEELHELIGDLWKGGITYAGPSVGSQMVLLESMEDHCYKCHRPMRTITGVAFPDKQLSRWDNPDWRYYQQVLPLSSLEGVHAQVVQRQVDSLRTGNPAITPVSYRYSQTVKENYFAACCPYCDALQGDFHVNNRRMDFLHDFDSRVSGQLQYHPVSLDVDYVLLSLVQEGAESCPHACGMGWQRRTELEVLKPPQWN